MEVVLILVAIIAGVTLFDYFTSRKWQQITSVERNTLVFENRNQEYGAYVLRKNYDRNMVIVMFSVVVGMIALGGVYLYIQNLPEPVIEVPKTDSQTFAVPAPPEEDVPPPPKEEVIPPQERTLAFIPPVVVDIEVDEELPSQEDLENVKADTKTNETDEVSWDPPVVGGEKAPEVIEKPKEDEILTFVDEEAKFNGNMMEFIQGKLRYPPSAMEMGAQGKCYVKFVVKANGSIANVSIERGVPGCPECDEEAVRVIRSMPPWIPGKNNGKSVSTWCRIPINFQLQ